MESLLVRFIPPELDSCARQGANARGDRQAVLADARVRGSLGRFGIDHGNDGA
jgi:hypothetical protein